MSDYRRDANEWAADHRLNPDGWLADPEAMLAMREAMSDVAEGRDTTRTDPLEVARDWWRSAYYRWSTGTGAAALEAAGQMVAVEREVADVERARASR
jgi:hypothetical protein